MSLQPVSVDLYTHTCTGARFHFASFRFADHVHGYADVSVQDQVLLFHSNIARRIVCVSMLCVVGSEMGADGVRHFTIGTLCAQAMLYHCPIQVLSECNAICIARVQQREATSPKTAPMLLILAHSVEHRKVMVTPHAECTTLGF